MKRELTVGLIVLMMVVTAVPTVIDADDYPEEYYAVLAENTYASEEGYPSHLDLRDLGLVTSVKAQGKFGTCWAHAVISCIETNLIKNGYADLSIDLSELHLAYYMVNQSTDPIGGYAGDTVKTSNYLTMGSNDNYSVAILSAWRGVALEKDVPYSMASPDLKLDPSTEYGLTKYIVTDAQYLNPYDRGAIKKALNGGDSVAVSYYASDKTAMKTFTDGDVRTVSYCTVDENVIMNHDVTIIGYDDSFPKENFVYTPKGDGAWLIKNSWGTNDPRVGSDGCFWLSYYSTGLMTATVFSAVPADRYDQNYGYDGGGSMHHNISYGSSGSMANVFTAVSDSTIDAISFYTMENGTTYTARVYTNLADPKDPTSGKLMSFTGGKCDYFGFHTVDIDPAYVKAGETFSVVVSLNNDSHDVELAVDTSVNAIDPYFDGVWAEVRTTASEGQSFVSGDGSSWTDIGTDGMSNVRVKAYADVHTQQDVPQTVILCVIAGLVIIIAAMFVINNRKNQS